MARLATPRVETTTKTSRIVNQGMVDTDVSGHSSHRSSTAAVSF